MKLLFILTVAAFLLYSVIAERNGPTNTRLSPRRKFIKRSEEGLQVHRNSGGRVIGLRHGSAMKRRRSSTVSKITRVSRTPRRTMYEKFPGTTFSKIGSTSSSARRLTSERLRVRITRNSPTRKFPQARRSFDVSVASDHIPESEINHDTIFLEPVIHEKPKKSFFGNLFDFGTDSDSHPKLGPLIGPVNFPGLGENVFIRLMVPPDEESSSHVTLHLVQNGPVHPSDHHEVYETREFPHIQNPKSLSSAKQLKNLGTISGPNVLIPSGSLNSRKSRFVGRSTNHFRFAPPKMETMEFFRALNHRKNTQVNANRRPIRLNNLPQYLPAQNHHQLPIVHRQSANNLIDLPIYPPLSNADDSSTSDKIEDNGYKNAQVNDSEGRLDDAEESESLKRPLVSEDRNFNVDHQTAGDWKSVGVFAFSEPQVTTSNEKESPQPVFIQIIPAPDLGAYNDSSKAKNLTTDQEESLDAELGAEDTSEDELEFFFDFSSKRNTSISKSNSTMSDKNFHTDHNEKETPSDPEDDSRSIPPTNGSNSTQKANGETAAN